MNIEQRLRDVFSKKAEGIRRPPSDWEAISRRLTRQRGRTLAWRLGTFALAALVSIGTFVALRFAFTPSRPLTPRDVGPTRSAPQARLATNIKLDAYPRAVAVGDGSAWVSLDPQDASKRYLVAKIDLDTNEVVSQIQTDGSGPLSPIAIGFGAMWGTTLEGGTPVLVRIDAETDQVLATIPGVGEQIAVGGGAVWSVYLPEREPSSTIVRVDPATNLVAGTIDVGDQIQGLAFGANALWVIGDSGDLIRIDPSTNEVVTRIRAGAFPWLIAVGKDEVWLSEGAASAVRVAIETNQVIGAPVFPEGAFRPFAADDSGVWYLATIDGGAAVAHLNSLTLTVDQLIPLETGPAAGIPPSVAYDPYSGTMWVADDSASVARIDVGV